VQQGDVKNRLDKMFVEMDSRNKDNLGADQIG